jgi:hypothetical protein
MGKKLKKNGDGDDLKKCIYCGKEFFSRKRLTRHERKHNLCEDCGVKFRSADELKFHKCQKTSDLLKKFVAGSPLPFPDVQEFYRVEVHKQKKARSAAKFVDLQLSFSPLEGEFSLSKLLERFYKIFANVFHVLTETAKEDDVIRFVFQSDEIDRWVLSPCEK